MVTYLDRGRFPWKLPRFQSNQYREAISWALCISVFIKTKTEPSVPLCTDKGEGQRTLKADRGPKLCLGIFFYWQKLEQICKMHLRHQKGVTGGVPKGNFGRINLLCPTTWSSVTSHARHLRGACSVLRDQKHKPRWQRVLRKKYDMRDRTTAGGRVST